jgi:PAS domain S-box-containing protein
MTPVDITHPDDVAETKAHYDKKYAGKLDSFNLEKRYLCKDGSIRWGYVNASVVRDLNGAVISLIAAITDITERKRAEKVIQRSEVLEQLATGAALKKVLNSIVINTEKHRPDTVCSVLLLDEDGEHLRHAAAPSLPDFFNAAIDGVEIGPDRCPCGAAAYTGEGVIVENIMSHPNWASYRELAEKEGLLACWSEPVISSTGKILGTFTIYYREPRAPSQSDLHFIRDSARLAAIAIEGKQAEEALRESEEKFRALSEKSIVGIYLLQEDEFRYVNPCFAEITGYSVEDIVGSIAPKDVVHPGDWPIVQENIRKRISGEAPSVRYEVRIIRKDGVLRNTEVFGTLTTYQGEAAIIGTLLDITERKRAEETIRASESKLRSILDSLQDVYYRTDIEGRVVMASPSTRQVTGYRPEQLIGKPIISFWRHPEKRKEMLEAMQVGGGAVQNYEVEGVHKDGSFVWGSINAHFYHDEEGDIAGVEGTIRDITTRKQAEEQTLQLLTQNRDLTQRMFQIQEEERRHLARELHDEFGQCLTAIQLNAKTISQFSDALHPDILSSAKIIAETATQMHKDIHAMVRYLRPALLDELGLLESLKVLADQWQAQHPHIDCTLSLDGQLNSLGDDLNITLYRVIQEALTNAAKHAKARHVSIQLNRQTAEQLSPETLHLTIVDDGVGMHTSNPGNGFGLPGMRERVLSSGGHFALNSEPGRGVRIEIGLPVSSEASA